MKYDAEEKGNIESIPFDNEQIKKMAADTFVVSLSNHERITFRQAQGERLEFLERLRISEKEVNEGKIKPFDLENLTKNVS